MNQTQLVEPLQTPAEAILRSALQLIAELGYSAMSMRCLAKQLGMHPGSLYHHFKSKTQVLEQVIENIIDQRFERWQCARPRRAQPLDLLKAFITFHVNDQMTFGRQEAPVLAEMRHLNSEQQARLSMERDRYLSEVITVISACVNERTHQHDLKLTALSIMMLLDNVPQLISSTAISSINQAVEVLMRLSSRLLKLEDSSVTSLSQVN